ncbi:MAG: pseudouridine synthase [Paludibacter sp.]|nr:pseudouridine synthase [Paludibacter sp.]
MKTNNEKWQGSSKPKSNAGAGRDGKPFEKRDVKSILKGTRGGAKFGSGKTGESRSDSSRPSYGDKKPFESRGGSSYGDKKPFENRGSSSYGEKKPYGDRDSRPSFGEKKSFESRGDKPAYGDRKPYGDRDNRPASGEKRSFRSSGSDSSDSGERKPYGDRENRPTFAPKKPWENKDSKPSFGERKPWENRDSKPSFGERKPWENKDSNSGSGERKPWENKDSKPAYGDRKPYESREGGRPSFGAKKPWENRDSKPAYGERKPWEDRTDSNGEKTYGRNLNAPEDESRPERLSFKKPGEGQKSEFIETRYDNKKDGVAFRKPARRADDDYDPNSKYSTKKQLEYQKTMVDLTKPLRLNKFLANAGICSRREADEYIQAGVISVNGEIVTEMGVKVLLTDKVMFHDQTVQSERKVYLLLNKPKDCVTTSEDTHDRLTVLDLVKNACSERIYPVGRLDRNTTGVLLLTNDGDLASKLTHPKYEKKKIYHVTLDKILEKADYETILAGITLDEDIIQVDALEFVKEGDLKQVGIEIHSGQNRVVRRIFEKLGYKIIRLDRVFFAGLTKKSLPRGKYRFLSEREVSMLKMGAHE